MREAETRRTERKATPEERQKFQKYHDQIEHELPELRRRAKQVEAAKRETAMREPTISGQLRRAVAESGYDHRELAEQVGVSGKALAEFLIGASPLDSATIDRIAALLKQELKSIG